MIAQVPPYAGAGTLIYRAATVPRYVGADGCFLSDSAGRRYLDAEAANGTLPFGYRPDILTSALARCASLPALPSFCESELRLRVLRRLEAGFAAEFGIPGRVELDLGGAQGMETALRIAFSANGPGPVMVFDGGYHGRSAATSMLSSSWRYRDLLGAPGLDVARLPSPDCAGCAFRPAGGGCHDGCVAAVSSWGGGASPYGGAGARRPVAALIIEAMQNVGGMVLPDSGLLRAAVEHARAQGALVIADEIFTGMHRIGPRWGVTRHGIVPDIVVASKGLTNGAAAVSVVWAREPLAAPDRYPPGSHSATYIGIPHALAVVDAVLDLWDGWSDVRGDVDALERALGRAVTGLAARHPDLVAAVGVCGATVRVVLAGPWAPRLRELCATSADTGLLVAATGMSPTVINIHPPLVFGADEVGLMGSLLDQALHALGKEL
jgi:4-aminobutyrate aminotransferase-like enzyme